MYATRENALPLIIQLYFSFAVRLWANKVKCTHRYTHTHRGKQASIFCSVTHCLKLPSLAWFWLFFLPPCFSLPLHPSLFSPAHHVWPLFSFPFFLFLFLCCLSFLILHSSSFSLRQKNGPVKNKFKSIKCKNEKVSQISF